MTQPRVLILRAPGTNCDAETAYAFQVAGAKTEVLHINRVLESPSLLLNYQILCVPGGFCYGDDVAAGRILGNQIQHHLADQIQRFKADGKLILTASIKDEFLKGTSSVVLAQDYYPTATIQLVADTSAIVRGVVVDEDLGSIAGATVSVEGWSEKALTDAKGNFVLPAHAGKGQLVEIQARKGPLSGTLSAPAGKVVEVVLTRQ